MGRRARGRARVQRLQKQGFGYQIAAAVIDIASSPWAVIEKQQAVNIKV